MVGSLVLATEILGGQPWICTIIQQGTRKSTNRSRLQPEVQLVHALFSGESPSPLDAFFLSSPGHSVELALS